MTRVLLFVVFLITYGSLYPWHFEDRQLGVNPAWYLLHSRFWIFSRAYIRDLFVNVALYVPLGLSAYLAFRRLRMPIIHIGAPVLLGFALSCTLEMVQLYVPSRTCSLADVIPNVAGSAIGVMVALIYRETLESLTRRQLERIPDPGVLALLLFWIAYLLFPFFPVISRYTLEQKAAIFTVTAGFNFVRFASATVCWLGAGRWLAAIGVQPVWKWLAALVLIIPGQLFIRGRQPIASDLLGAAAGCLCFALSDRSRYASRIAAAGFLFLLALHGLAPFRLRTDPNVFGWIPFTAMLESEWQFGAFILVEKLFYYWAAIWAMRSAGIGLRTATLIVATTLVVIEAAQIYLPGRTPEVTDPILALIIGVALHLLDSRRQSDRLGLAAVDIN